MFIRLDSLGLGVDLSLYLGAEMVLMILGMLLLEHEVDGDVFELVFLWDVGFRSFMVFDICG
jgi:hypothetical protein